MTCLRKTIVAGWATAFLLYFNVSLAVETGPFFDDRVDGKSARESIKKNLNIFFLIDVSESMHPFADYLNSFNKRIDERKEKGVEIRINRVYAYGDSSTSDRNVLEEPNFIEVKGLDGLDFTHKSRDRNYAEPLIRAFKKVLDEIELLQNQKLLPSSQEKLLFVITDAGPNDLTDGAFNDIVARAQHLNLLVYFVYPSRPSVRIPHPQMDDQPAQAYSRLEEMIVRFEKSSLPGQAVRFRRVQVETEALESPIQSQEDFRRQPHRLLEAIKAYMDHAEMERERVVAAMYAGAVSELKQGRWETARNRLYENLGLFEESLSSPQREQAAGLTEFFRTLDEGDQIMNRTPQTVQAIDEALSVYGRAGEQAKALSPGIEVGLIVEEKTARAAGLQAALRTQRQQELAAAQQATAAPPPPAVDRNAEINQALSRFDEKNYAEAFNHFSAVYGSQIDSIRQRDQRRIESLLSLPPKCRAEIVFLVELERIRQKSNNDPGRIKMGLEDLLQDIDNRMGPWVVIPEIRRERIKQHITEFQ